MEFRLTKTSYLKYLKCPPEFWLSIREPLLVVEPDTLEYEHLRQQGYAVEQFVKQLARFQPGEVQTVDFQRTFQTAQFSARSDVVVTNTATGEVEIYEIKASGSVKDEHYDDVAFQRMAAEAMGTVVTRCYVITMNGEYVRRGDIDPEQLFKVNDVTDEVAARVERTAEQARAAIAYLDTVPVPSLAGYCAANKLRCKFITLHFPDLPEYTVFDIAALHPDKRRALVEQGIIDILDVPDDFPLSDRQRRQVAAAKSGEVEIDREAIRERMDQWEYPLHFLDYETFSYAIPQFDGVRPFQQMCFQYSLHTIETPGGPLLHDEYLARRDEANPQLALVKHLKDAFSTGIGTIFVWSESFEKKRNDELAAAFPEYKEFLDEVNEKTVDLMRIFKERLYMHPALKGRISIKKVLPVVSPNTPKYEDLGIAEGLTASISWFRAVKWDNMPDTVRESIFQDLLEYCELDTRAMVDIYQVLRAL